MYLIEINNVLISFVVFTWKIIIKLIDKILANFLFTFLKLKEMIMKP